MEHPETLTIMRTGYPSGVKEPKIISTDSLGYEIYEGDEIFVLGDDVFVKEELSYDAVEILEKIGADLEIAE